MLTLCCMKLPRTREITTRPEREVDHRCLHQRQYVHSKVEAISSSRVTDYILTVRQRLNALWSEQVVSWWGNADIDLTRPGIHEAEPDAAPSPLVIAPSGQTER